MKMGIVSFDEINAEHRDLAAQCIGVVEANSFERHMLWSQYSPKSDRCYKGHVSEWQELGSGCMFGVGRLAGHDVCVQIWFARLDDKWVMFYDPCSRIVDHDLVTEWRVKYMSHAKHTDANNFHIIIHSLRD
jgi:hypothetical protein